MGLINLQSSLKNLGFGDDRYKRGNSNEPYIQTQIPATNDPLQTGFSLSGDNIISSLGIIAATTATGFVFGGPGSPTALIGAAAGLGVGIASAVSTNDLQVRFKAPNAGTGGPDFLLRGGTLLPNRIVNDVERISKLIIDTKSAKGFLFVTKQNILSRLAVKTEGTRGNLLNDGVYLPTSTLASVAGVAFGGYFNKQGLNPFEGVGEGYVSNRYYSVIKDQLITDILINNRLFNLYETKILNDFDFNSNEINTLDENNLISYRGGPGAPLGIGKTNIKIISPEQRTGINNINVEKLYNLNPQDLSRPNFEVIKRFTLGNANQTKTTLSGNIIDYSDLGGASNAYSTTFDQPILDNGFNGEGGSQTKIFGPNDKNLTLSGLSASLYPESITLGYNNKIIRKKILDNEKARIDNKAYLLSLNDNSGSYNKIAEFKSIDKQETNTGGSVDRIGILKHNIEADNFDENNDIIDFSISIIGKDSYYFPAYINSFSDGYSAKWNTEKFLGRGEDFYTYNGFSRDFSLSFTTYARNPYAMQRMYNNLNKITAALTPDYGSNGFMKGNLFRITLGSYLNDIPCIIESFKFDNIIADNVNWQLTEKFALPYLFNINMSFKPIYNRLPSIDNPTFIDPSLINDNMRKEIDKFNDYKTEAIP
jgi:hypothetical protein